MNYSPECDQKALEILSLTGKDRAAWEGLGITKNCFYVWIRTQPSFSDAVARGKQFYNSHSPETQRVLLTTYIADILRTGGETITVTTVRPYRSLRILRNNKNERIGSVETEGLARKTVTINRGIPKWIADKILPNASSLDIAIATVLAAGYEIRRPNSPVNK